MSIETQLRKGLEEHVQEDAGRQVAEDWREEAIENLEDSYQGAPKLIEFFTDVSQQGEEFVFHIEHPTARLHEIGAHIEPAYAQAAAMGWTRDEFYEGLKDCEEFVKPKRYMRDGVFTLRRKYR